MITYLLAGSSVAALLPFAPSAALAQTGPSGKSEISPAPAPSPTQAVERSAGELQAVVITARRTKENIVTTPEAVTALSAAALQARDVTSLEDLAPFTPGFHQTDVNFGRNDRAYQTYEMRGIYGGDGQQRQPVRLFVDGVPIASGMIAGLDDIDRVEVVRGPQSAYFGRSTFAGAVNFITRAPSFTPESSGSFEFGSYGYRELRAGVEGPVIDNVLSFRLSTRYYNSDGDYRNAYDGSRMGAQETKSIAGNLLFKPISSLRIKAFAQYWEDEDGPSAQGLLNASYRNCNPKGGVTPTFICGAVNQVPGQSIYWNTSFSPAVIGALNSPQVGRQVDSSLVDHLGLGRHAWQAFTSFEYDLPGRWLLSGNAGVDDDQYRDILDNFQQKSTSTFAAASINDDRDFSGELRIQSPEYFNLVKGMVGINYLDASIVGNAAGYRGVATNPSTTSVFSQISAAADYTDVYSRTLGFFGSLHFDLTSKLKLDLEGRQQADDITQKILQNQFSVPGSQQVVAEKTFYTFTPKGTLSYLFKPETMVYASYAAGSRPGQFNAALFSLPAAARAALLAQAPVSLAVAPEKLDMYEIGYKSEIFDHRLRVLADAYYGRWYRRQVTSPVFYTPPGALTIVQVNAISGNSTVVLYGVEGEADFRATRNLTLEGTFAYNETDIRRSYCASCFAITGNGDWIGNRLPGYAPFTGTASVNYTHDLAPDLQGFVRVDYIYSGKQYEQEDNLTYVPPANTVNARIGIHRHQYSLEIYGKNIFDDKAPTSIFTQTNLYQGGFGLIVSPPLRASIGARLSVNY